VATASVVVVILALLGLGTSQAAPWAAAAGRTPPASPAVPWADGTGRPPPAGSPARSSPAPSSSAAPSSPAATSPPAAGARQLADPLGGTAASYLAGRSGSVLAAVYDISSGQTWTLGHGRPQAEASVVKLDILETLLAQHGGGLPAGDQALARQMIENSDNDAAASLWDLVGGASAIHSYNATAGLTHTTLSPCVRCAGFAWPGWGLSSTLPTDQIALLRRLVEPGPALSGSARQYALSLMENVTPAQRWGVCGGVPAQATVALKNGWLPLNPFGTDWQVNSVGWISGLGRDYLMAVLSTGGPDEQYGIDTISRLGAIVWAGLG
jgi:beta-lactamase class A